MWRTLFISAAVEVHDAVDAAAAIISLLKSFWTAATQLVLKVAQERHVDESARATKILESCRRVVFDERQFLIDMPIWVDPFGGRVVCFSLNFVKGVILSVGSAARAQFVRLFRDDDDDCERGEFFSLGMDIDPVIFKSGGFGEDSLWSLPIMFPFLTVAQARQVCGGARQQLKPQIYNRCILLP